MVRGRVAERRSIWGEDLGAPIGRPRARRYLAGEPLGERHARALVPERSRMMGVVRAPDGRGCALGGRSGDRRGGHDRQGRGDAWIEQVATLGLPVVDAASLLETPTLPLAHRSTSWIGMETCTSGGCLSKLAPVSSACRSPSRGEPVQPSRRSWWGGDSRLPHRRRRKRPDDRGSRDFHIGHGPWASTGGWRADESSVRSLTPRYASLRREPSPLSSRGLGRRPLTAETRVRIPVAVSTNYLQSGRFPPGNGLIGNLAHRAVHRIGVYLPTTSSREMPCGLEQAEDRLARTS